MKNWEQFIETEFNGLKDIEIEKKSSIHYNTIFTIQSKNKEFLHSIIDIEIEPFFNRINYLRYTFSDQSFYFISTFNSSKKNNFYTEFIYEDFDLTYFFREEKIPFNHENVIRVKTFLKIPLYYGCVGKRWEQKIIREDNSSYNDFYKVIVETNLNGRKHVLLKNYGYPSRIHFSYRFIIIAISIIYFFLKWFKLSYVEYKINPIVKDS